VEIVYTYKSPTMKIYSREVNQKDWISRSIKSARMVGYSPHLYTNDLEFAQDLDLDNITIVEDKYPLIWDTLKPEIFLNRTDMDFFISDNDVIYKKPIPFDDNVDFFHDGIEINNWGWVYSDTMDYLKDKKLFDHNKIWCYEKKEVLNLGILKINNLELRKKYFDFWIETYNTFNRFVKDKPAIANSAIINQYTLTLLFNSCNYSKKHFTNGGWPGNNEYYNHYPGYTKFKETYSII